MYELAGGGAQLGSGQQAVGSRQSMCWLQCRCVRVYGLCVNSDWCSQVAGAVQAQAAGALDALTGWLASWGLEW